MSKAKIAKVVRKYEVLGSGGTHVTVEADCVSKDETGWLEFHRDDRLITAFFEPVSFAEVPVEVPVA